MYSGKSYIPWIIIWKWRLQGSCCCHSVHPASISWWWVAQYCSLYSRHSLGRKFGFWNILLYYWLYYHIFWTGCVHHKWRRAPADTDALVWRYWCYLANWTSYFCFSISRCTIPYLLASPQLLYSCLCRGLSWCPRPCYPRIGLKMLKPIIQDQELHTNEVTPCAMER